MALALEWQQASLMLLLGWYRLSLWSPANSL